MPKLWFSELPCESVAQRADVVQHIIFKVGALSCAAPLLGVSVPAGQCNASDEALDLRPLFHQPAVGSGLILNLQAQSDSLVVITDAIISVAALPQNFECQLPTSPSLSAMIPGFVGTASINSEQVHFLDLPQLIVFGKDFRASQARY